MNNSRLLILLPILALLVDAAYGMSHEPIHPAKGHPLVGTWQWTRNANQCTEIYEFREDGTVPVTSGQEVTGNVYEVSATPDINRFYRLTMRVTQDNGGKDCGDDTADNTGEENTTFIQFSPDQSMYVLCEAPTLKRCLGPLRRVR